MKNIINQIFEDILDYFKNLSKIYRNSGELKECCQWLKTEVEKLGLKTEIDKYKPNFGNILFTIDANDSKLDDLILQAHYDMVVVSDNLEETKKKGIEIVEEIVNHQRIWHSKEYKTSLGADDGAGVAIILALAKNRNKFNHGKIKFILTADEEVPQGGAAVINKKWVEKDKYLLNLDNSSMKWIMTGCQAAIVNKFKKEYKLISVNNKEKQWKIKIHNLVGGHSSEINNSQANSIDLIFKLLLNIDKCKIVKFNNFNNLKINAICPESEIEIICDKFESELKTIIDNFLKDNKYINDKKIKIDIFKSPRTDKCMSENDSRNLSLFITGLNYGALEIDNFNYPITSINIGPLIFDINNEKVNVLISSMSRTKIKKDINNLIDTQTKNTKKYNFELVSTEIDPIWVEKKNSKIQKLRKAIDKNKYKPIFVCSPAWLEPSEFAKLNKNLDMISIGPESDWHHTKKEMLFIDSIKPFLKQLLELFKLLKKEAN